MFKIDILVSNKTVTDKRHFNNLYSHTKTVLNVFNLKHQGTQFSEDSNTILCSQKQITGSCDILKLLGPSFPISLWDSLERKKIRASFVYTLSAPHRITWVLKILKFSFLPQTLWCDHSLESSLWDDSNEWSHNRFWGEIKEMSSSIGLCVFPYIGFRDCMAAEINAQTCLSKIAASPGTATHI